MSKKGKLDGIFRPKSVAVIGASSRKKSLGWEILNNLILSGFNGKLFPVNPKADHIHSIKAYSSILDVKDKVDLAVIAIPANGVLKVVNDCGKKGVKGLVIITAGFREMGGAGILLEEKLMKLVRKYNMRMVGPNCMGVINTDENVKLNASFAGVRPEPGKIGFLSQSGALGESILNHAKNLGIGISKFVSMGNKPDISGNDLLEEWEHDENVKVILMYLESFGNPKRFTKIAKQVSRYKPIIAVKAGRTVAGARATISHTGALAGVDVATGALFAQCGVIRVTSIEEMFDVSKAFLNQPVPKNGKVAILSNAGGPAIMATDACVRLGLEVPELSKETQAKLKKVLPIEAAVANPVDIIATGGPERYEAALNVLIKDKELGSIITVFIPPLTIDAPAVARVIAKANKRTKKTILSVFMAKDEAEEGIQILKNNNVPVYLFPESAAKALSAMVRRRLWLDKPEGKIKRFNPNIDRVKKIIKAARREKRRALTLQESFEVLQSYGIKSLKPLSATDVEEALSNAKKIGYPVVLKLDSIKASHKSDIGGVMLDLRSDQEVKEAFKKIKLKARKAKIAWSDCTILVQEYISEGIETILGVQQNPSFGPLMMFGLGGVHVEVLKDVSFGITPLSDVAAKDMVRYIRGYPLLKGVRGEKAIDENALVDSLQRLSKFVSDFEEIAEMDINPFLLRPKPKSSLALDARILLTEL
ncbi:MAG: acetate--CoA ligase family protein [Candidatus Marinimicrobia bacterium]|nr:acetate--CoA ligase family protein [Candidatus Neomarinimicrobiota bacterium]